MAIITVESITKEVNTDPSPLEAIVQRAQVILSTIKLEALGNRGLGLSWDFLDQPQGRARARLIREITRQIQKNVPELRVEEISFKHLPLDGSVFISLRCKIES